MAFEDSRRSIRFHVFDSLGSSSRSDGGRAGLAARAVRKLTQSSGPSSPLPSLREESERRVEQDEEKEEEETPQVGFFERFQSGRGYKGQGGGQDDKGGLSWT